MKQENRSITNGKTLDTVFKDNFIANRWVGSAVYASYKEYGIFNDIDKRQFINMVNRLSFGV